MRIACISDTHGLHERIKLQPGEILIHAGDVTEFGTEQEMKDFIEWFSIQPFEIKAFIAGNHDLILETKHTFKIKKRLPNGLKYLENSGFEIQGIKFWGSPVTPYYLGMAFNKRGGEEIKKVWQKIPNNTDILITHGPPLGILDLGLGCDFLADKVRKIRPRYHIFGHVHEQQGIIEKEGVRYINAAMVNSPDPMINNGFKVIGKVLEFEI